MRRYFYHPLGKENYKNPPFTYPGHGIGKLDISGANMPLYSMTYMQLISYYTSCLLGNNPDKPRSLAKSVTDLYVVAIPVLSSTSMIIFMFI